MRDLEHPLGYRRWLTTQRDWHGVARAKLEGYPIGQPGFSERLEALAADLKNLNPSSTELSDGVQAHEEASAVHRPPVLRVAAASEAEQLGWAYVVLGAQNGNAQLFERLSGVVTLRGAMRFLSLYQTTTHTPWTAMTRRLAGLSAEGDAADAATTGACDAFAAYVALSGPRARSHHQSA